MPKEIQLPTYIKLKATKKKTKIVTQGEYVGTVPGKLGPSLSFFEVKDSKQVVVKAGKLLWLVEQQHIVEGGIYDVTYVGTEKIEKGEWAGTDAHQFKVERYTNGEIEEIKEANPEWEQITKGEIKQDVVAEPVVDSPEKEALDDLE